MPNSHGTAAAVVVVPQRQEAEGHAEGKSERIPEES